MKRGPKYKVCRRLGPGVYEKCQTEKFVLSESKKNPKRLKRRRNISDYGTQLLEKQKVRLSYGMTEKQFRGYVKKASSARGISTIEKLFELLESRLDNVVYRTGLAPTRAAARQLVTHGHILINGKKTKAPSSQIRKGDKISVREGSKGKAVFENRREELKEYKQPSWLAFNPSKFEGSIKGSPVQKEAGVLYDLTSVIEFYSR